MKNHAQVRASSERCCITSDQPGLIGKDRRCGGWLVSVTSGSTKKNEASKSSIVPPITKMAARRGRTRGPTPPSVW
jgi:hypothetical protein